MMATVSFVADWNNTPRLLQNIAEIDGMQSITSTLKTSNRFIRDHHQFILVILKQPTMVMPFSHVATGIEYETEKAGPA